jgi:50S ribosomal subunit-associated GTPase HflX
MKRHLAENEKKITEKLQVFARTRAQHRQSRKRKDFKTI